MSIRRYNKHTDESRLMEMIKNEEGWDYADDNIATEYKTALETSITYVAEENGEICGYSRSLDDFGSYIYVCDLLVRPDYRGKGLGRQLMEILCKDFPNQTIFVMSDVDEYYQKLKYSRAGSIFQVG